MRCANRVSQSVERFMRDAGLSEAFLLGGAVLDPLVDEQAKISDYDICVRDEESFYQTLQNLERKGCAVSDVMRTHNIYAVISHPQLGMIDFSCMDPEDNGIYNVERIYARFQQRGGSYTNAVVDRYGAIDGIKRGVVKIVSGPEKEGAYNVLRRFLALSGKYNLDISLNGLNQETVDRITASFKSGYHYVPQDKVRCLSRLVASLRRVKNRHHFVKNLGEQGILQNAFPDVHKLFSNPLFQNCEKLKDCQTQKELLELMMANVDFKDRDAMVDCMLLLSKREKARQDKGVREFVEGVEREKTSPQRLAKVLYPVFGFIQSKARN